MSTIDQVYKKATPEQVAWAEHEYRIRSRACAVQGVEFSLWPSYVQILWEIVGSPKGALDDVASYREMEPPHQSYEQYRSPKELAA